MSQQDMAKIINSVLGGVKRGAKRNIKSNASANGKAAGLLEGLRDKIPESVKDSKLAKSLIPDADELKSFKNTHKLNIKQAYGDEAVESLGGSLAESIAQAKDAGNDELFQSLMSQSTQLMDSGMVDYKTSTMENVLGYFMHDTKGGVRKAAAGSVGVVGGVGAISAVSSRRRDRR